MSNEVPSNEVPSNEVIVVIMAGGLGKRMGSSLPKVLHKINKGPMICHVLYNAIVLNSNIKKNINSCW
jgi:bifunctional N-acetylglucosamine-1-phosphate-uridyltransferase/glucosamine-1-phosphate-acetyltransferase GlmU-like protein